MDSGPRAGDLVPSAKTCTVAFVLNHRFYRIGKQYYADVPNLLDLMLALGRQAGKCVLCVPTKVVTSPPPWTKPVPAELDIFELPFYSSYFSLIRHVPHYTLAMVRAIRPAVKEWDVVGGVAPSGYGLLTVVMAVLGHCPAFFFIRGNVLASLWGEYRHSPRRRLLVTGSMLPLDLLTRLLVRGGITTFTFGPTLAKRYPGPRVHVLHGYARQSLVGKATPIPVRESAPLRRLLYVGRLTGEKGPDVLIDAMSLLARRGIDTTLTIAGEGSERDALQERAQARGVGHRVEFVGYVTEPEQLRRLYMDSGVLVLPSRTEGLPTVVLEAMALARIVIATDVGGVSALIVHGKDGLIVPPEDPEALAGAIERVIAHPDEAFELSTQALATSRTRDVDSEARWILDHVLGSPQQVSQYPPSPSADVSQGIT